MSTNRTTRPELPAAHRSFKGEVAVRPCLAKRDWACLNPRGHGQQSASFPVGGRVENMNQQTIVTLDLEGVLVPEIWIAFAEKTGIEQLKLTTRDIPDYDELMTGRLAILNEHGLKLADIQEVIGTLAPLEGAKAFLDELRSLTQVVILSDTFLEFAKPLMEQLAWPTIFCHDLEIDAEGRVANYRLRQPDQKRKAVTALQLPMN